MSDAYRLYLVTDPRLGGDRPLEQIVEAAVAGGVTLVQLRDKDAEPAAVERRARSLLRLLDGTGVPLLVNDHLSVAQTLGIGLHVGSSDSPPDLARTLLGPDVLIGASLGGGRAMPEAHWEALSYAAVGPVWATQTKRDTGPAVGTEAVERVTGSLALPVVAIGGITPARARSAVLAGAAGVAVVSDIVAAADPAAAARELREAVDAALAERG
ncbi:thiamine-phosphate diphosphorylase [Motilibacter rhizosphaerae]|uniref:Thiamine-phosphate synthase n=1 Tax=Motilibacter rhizosphaerae TaxID=598652 RepID=A0A4V2F4B6_9ACTN|nr:thiamine phosphate synthase [Motilibacter rhizosphaerae]RZS87037.1 thiamine-phosphate diphosphorylase [Motilibacter rhizosphaerae]